MGTNNNDAWIGYELISEWIINLMQNLKQGLQINIQYNSQKRHRRMSDCPSQTPIYRSLYSSAPDTTAITIIILSVIMPLQLLCFLGFCIYSRNKTKLSIQPHHQQQPHKQTVHNKTDHISRSKNDEHFQNKTKIHINKQKGRSQGNVCINLFNKIQNCVANCTTQNKLMCVMILLVGLILGGVVVLSVSIAASEQALNKQYSQAECKLNSTVSKFVSGDADWVGLSYMVPNLTKLQLNLNTRIKATKNSITALVLNGTNATFPIGFPNGTRITDTITGTNIIATSVQTYIDASLRQWLFRNSSLSSTYRFPICQTSTISNIPHPINDGQTIQLNYMTSICNNLTNQVNALVANGKAVDQLLAHTTSVENTRSSTNSNLSSFNNSITGISLRSNEYKSQLSSTKQNLDALRALPFVLLGLNFLALIVVVPFICYQFCKVKKYTSSVNNEENLQIKRQNKYKKQAEINIENENISVSGASDLTPSQTKIKKRAKMRQLLRNGIFPSSPSTHAINVFFMLIVFAVGLSSIVYTNSINTSKAYCNSFKQAMTADSMSQVPYLSSSQKQLLTPVQNCLNKPLSAGPTLNAVNSLDHFLQTAETPIYLSSVEKLYKVSQMYNQTTPVNVLNSISLQQIQILKNYLLHMETMPVKSADFTVSQVLAQLNAYTNGTASGSRQLTQCGASILRDQYVYNVATCDYNLISYIDENLITAPRCLQIPTWQGSGGTKDADLNDAQHTIQLNTTCPTIYDFFNGTNGACFLGKRLDLLRTANCISTASEYNRRLKNLIKFSVQTASYTNSYLQNLRNYFGVYSVLSTNLTQFFNGANSSQILNQFGTLSNNLLNKSSCSYVRSAVSTVYDAYCPQNNTISMLLFECYVLIFATFGILSASWGLIIIWQVAISAYGKKLVASQPQFIDVKHYEDLSSRQPKQSRNQLNKSRKQHKKQVKVRPARNINLEISEQTLKNQQHEEDDKISRLKRLQIIENNNDDQIEDNIENLEIAPNYRTLQHEKKSSQSQQSENNTQQRQAEYDHEHLHSQQTGKKLLNRNTPLQILNKPPSSQIVEQYNRMELHKELDMNPKAIESNQNTGKLSNDANRYEPNALRSEEAQQDTEKKKPIKIFKMESDQGQKEDKPIFFGNPVDFSVQRFEDDSRKDDFLSKQSDKKDRKVQSKAEVRHYKNQYQPPRSISRITKQEAERQRQRAAQLDQILKHTIEIMDNRSLIKNKQKSPTKGQEQ